jgi:hypothetical protein
MPQEITCVKYILFCLLPPDGLGQIPTTHSISFLFLLLVFSHEQPEVTGLYS